MPRLHHVFGIIAPTLLLSHLLSQSAPAGPANSKPTFQAKVRVVVVDVVVTNRTGGPIGGLPREDFEVSEDGHPQKVLSFEEHKGAPPTEYKIPPMPPNVFTNFPTMKTADSVNVVLLDTLNTSIEDQAYVHSEMMKYLKTPHPGTRMAIFTLASRLRLVQGFTTDSSLLLAALNDRKAGGGPQQSVFLSTPAEKDVDNQAVSQLEQMGALTQADALRQFQADSQSFQTDNRVRMTLEAMQQLSSYLSGIPGRKNVIWFSGSFPLNIFPDANVPDPFNVLRDYGREVQKTADLLTVAQVAIYPVGAEGLDPSHLYDASNSFAGVATAQQARRFQTTGLQDENNARSANHLTMDQIAKDTGGEAFYNTNGLSDAVARVVNNGSRFYTLTYTPSNLKMDSEFRHIHVKVLHGSYKLAYRRGYYTQDQKVQARMANIDALQPLMGPGLPDITQIVYKIRVTSSIPAGEKAGDNPKRIDAVTRYKVDFAVPVADIKFEMTPDGMRHCNVEASLYVYDHEGNVVNWVNRRTEITMKPETYAVSMRRGLQLSKVIDVPKGDFYLRTGVYDPASKNAGTLQIALRAVVAEAPAVQK